MDISKVDDAFQTMFKNQQTANNYSVYANIPDGKSRWRFVSAAYPDRQHYVKDLDDEQNRFVPCPGKRTCPICAAGLKSGFKYRFVGINRTNKPDGLFASVDDVEPKFVAVPVGVAQTIFSVIEDGNSIMDQDFIIEKTGKGIKTTYTAFPSTKNAPLSDVELEAIKKFPEPETLVRKPPTFEELSYKSYEDPRNSELVFHGRNSKHRNAAQQVQSVTAQPEKESFTGQAQTSKMETSWDDFN